MSAERKRSSLPAKADFGRSAPFATVLISPAYAVHHFTIRLVSVSL